MVYLQTKMLWTCLFVIFVEATQASFFSTIVQSFSSPLGGSFSKLNYGSYYKGPVCTPREAIRHPKSKQEVVNIVREAIYKRTTCKAYGHRHSATDIICTDGIPIDMTGIQGMVMNPDNTVRVGAGVSLYDLCNFLMAYGRGLKTMPAFGNITVAGSVGTGAHGSSIKHSSSISGQVVGLEIVDGLGNVRYVSSIDDLRAFRVHLGLLGIILELTLATHPLYKVRAHNYAVSDNVLYNGQVIEMAKNTDQISMYWFPSMSKLVIANWTIVDVNTPGNAFTNDHTPPTYSALNFLAVPLSELAHALKSTMTLDVLQRFSFLTLIAQVPLFMPIYTENGFTVKNPAVGYYNNMFAPICKDSGYVQCPWFHGPNNLTQLDNEVSIDLHDLPRYVRVVKDILSKYEARFPGQGVLLRFSAASETFMSVSYGRITCHFEFYMGTRKDHYKDPSLGLAAYQAMMQELVYGFKGRSHWGKSGMYYHSTEQIQNKLDPVARRSFLTKMYEYDPNGVFMNDFGNRIKGTGTVMNTDPLTTHCALLDNCLCSKNSDCAQDQICSEIPGYPKYPVCMDLNIDSRAFSLGSSLASQILTNLTGYMTSLINSVGYYL